MAAASITKRTVDAAKARKRTAIFGIESFLASASRLHQRAARFTSCSTG